MPGHTIAEDDDGFLTLSFFFLAAFWCLRTLGWHFVVLHEVASLALGLAVHRFVRRVCYSICSRSLTVEIGVVINVSLGVDRS